MGVGRLRSLEACNDFKEPVGATFRLDKSLSGVHLLRDAHGVRTLTGREVAALHGYAPRTIGASESAATSNQTVSTAGDGFDVNVVRDIVRRMITADAEC